MRGGLLLAVIVLWSVTSPSADAASYDVRACDAAPGAANNAWLAFATASGNVTEAGTTCPSQAVDPSGDVAQGLWVNDVLAGPDSAADGSYREWRFVAPAATKILAFELDRDIGNRSALNGGAYTPYGQIDGQDLASETCYRPTGQFLCRILGSLTRGALSADEIAWGIRCVRTKFCDGGATLHDVWVALRAATVTIDDSVAPTVSAPTGQLTDTAVWQSGTRGITFSGADSTGIRELAVYDGNAQVAAKAAPGPVAGGCGVLNQGLAFTYTEPCGGSRGVNGAQTLQVDTRGFGNGTRSLRVVVRDTVDNHTFSSPIQIKVDNEAPPAPTVTTTASWSTAPDATWSWTLPAESDRAPITGIEAERCPQGGACVIEPVPASATSYTRDVPEGVSTVRVRVVDAAGNVGAWSAARSVLRDRTAPAVTIESLAGPVDPGVQLDPKITSQDPLSGLAANEREYRVNGGPWAAAAAPVAAPAGSTLRFRARAIDVAGNVSAWVESADLTVRAIAQEPDPTPLPTTVAPITGSDASTAATALQEDSASPLELGLKQAMIVRRGRLVRLRARRHGAHIHVTGRVAPSYARGRVVVMVRSNGRRWRVGRAVRRRGRFSITITRPVVARSLVVRYGGDALHLPKSRRVPIRAAPRTSA